MSHHPDLSTNPQTGETYVGWLDPSVPFPTGTVSPHLLERLETVAAHHVLQTRGFHPCPFCTDHRSTRIPPATEYIDTSGETRLLGSAEMRVIPKDGGPIFAAPNLVLHYIAVHTYLPPKPFLDALESCALPGEPAFSAALRPIWQ